MSMLLSHGFDINEVHRIYRDTALLSAVKREGDGECVRVVTRLLDFGADMEIMDAVEGHTAVMLAALGNKVETTKVLVKSGARVAAHYRPFVESVVMGEFKDQGEWNSLICMARVAG